MYIVYICMCMYVTASSSTYMRSSSGICSELGSLPFSLFSCILSLSLSLSLSLNLSPPRYLEFSRKKKKKIHFLLCLSRKSIHTHYQRYRTRVCPRVTVSGKRRDERESKEKGFIEKSVSACAGRRNIRIRTALHG